MRKIFLVFILALSVFGVVGFAFTDDDINRDKVPYNPAIESLWNQWRTDPEIIPPEVKNKKNKILMEWFAWYFVLSEKSEELVEKELKGSIASIVIEETFYKILRHGDFSMPTEEMAENLKNKAIDAIYADVTGYNETKEISEILARNAVKTMVAVDDYSEAFTPEEYRDFLSLFNNSCGIGVLIKKHQEGAEIVDVQMGGAEKAGLKKGDIITGVNGIGLKDLSIYKILPLLKDAINTKVILGVIRDGIELRPVEVIRSPVKSVEAKKYGAVGYIKVTLFTDNVAKDFEDALVELLGSGTIHSFVIDLRGNPGGSIEEANKILNNLTEQGVLFCLRSGKQIEKVFVSNNKPLFRGKIAVLADNNSASASELVAGALQCRGAKIVGEKTYGKGSIQQLFVFPENNVISAIKFTAGRYEIFNPKDKKYFPVDKIGIEPDIKIDPTLPIEEILDIPEIKEYLSK